MGTNDYLDSIHDGIFNEAALEPIPDAPWDPELSATMRERGVAAYEESLLPFLLEDLRRGVPGCYS